MPLYRALSTSSLVYGSLVIPFPTEVRSSASVQAVSASDKPGGSHAVMYPRTGVQSTEKSTSASTSHSSTKG